MGLAPLHAGEHDEASEPAAASFAPPSLGAPVSAPPSREPLLLPDPLPELPPELLPEPPPESLPELVPELVPELLPEALEEPALQCAPESATIAEQMTMLRRSPTAVSIAAGPWQGARRP
jgi:hypothetical protein